MINGSKLHGHSGNAGASSRRGMRDARPEVASASPRPSPAGRRRIVRHLGAQPERFDKSQRGEGNWNIGLSASNESCSLSLRERVRVRGNEVLLSGRGFNR